MTDEKCQSFQSKGPYNCKLPRRHPCCQADIDKHVDLNTTVIPSETIYNTMLQDLQLAESNFMYNICEKRVPPLCNGY